MISKYQVNRNKKLVNYNIKNIAGFDKNGGIGSSFNIIRRHIKIFTANYCPFCDNFSEYKKQHDTNFIDISFTNNYKNVKYIFNNSYPCHECSFKCVEKFWMLNELKGKLD
jgi:hypothetical protein